MTKPYRAVPLPSPGRKMHLIPVTVLTETDFDALDKAKKTLGFSVAFELWDGDRLALTFRPYSTGVEAL